MDAEEVLNYIIPCFTALWALIFFILLDPEGNVNLEVLNTVIVPIIVGVIGILGVRKADDKKINIFRIVVGLGILTLGIIAFVIGKSLVTTGIILTIGAELLGLGTNIV